MQTFLVTGGAGFIGSNLVRLLLAETDARVVVVDNLTYAGNLQSLAEVSDDPRFHFVRADIADRTALDEIFRTHTPTSVVNLAAETHVDRSIDAPDAFLRSNVVGTFQLLEASRAYLASAGLALGSRFRLLHVSTDEVYGSLGATGAFQEDTAYAPNSPYAASKAAADHLVRAWFQTYQLPTLITNCSNNYGPNQFPEKFLPLFLLNALDARDLPIYGDGGQIRDWLYVDDHCRGILLVLERGRLGEKYNIGAGDERTNLQMVDLLCNELELQRPAALNPVMRERGITHYTDLKTFVADRPGHDRRYAVDASKIRRELGWQPRCDLRAGLARTVAWYLSNLAWCEAVQSGGYRRERLGLAKATRPA